MKTLNFFVICKSPDTDISQEFRSFTIYTEFPNQERRPRSTSSEGEPEWESRNTTGPKEVKRYPVHSLTRQTLVSVSKFFILFPSFGVRFVSTSEIFRNVHCLMFRKLI